MASETFQHRITKQDLTKKMKDLSDILNNSWDGIAIIDENGNFIFSNNAFAPILNYSKDELQKLNLINLAHESSRDVLKFAIIKASKLGNLKNVKTVFNRKDKQHVYLELAFMLMTNGKYFVLNARDYTEKVAKDEIINKYVLSCQIDTNGNINEISEAFLSLIDYARQELISQNFNTLVKNSDLNFLDIIKNIKCSDNWSGILKIAQKSAKIIWLDTIIKPQINKYGDIIGYILISFDITAKKQLVELNESLKVKLKSSEEDSKQKSDHILSQSKFASINTILQNIIHNWLEPLHDIEHKVDDIATKDYPKEQMQSQLKTVSKSMKNLSSNIEKFQKSFQIKTKPVPTNIKKILANIIAMLERNNEKHQIVIHQDLKDVPSIDSYPNELMDVILSIITNSLEAFRKKQTKNPLIDINLSKLDNNIIIQILDNAGGIAKEIIDKVFEPYFSTKGEKGKGMGLYFAKSLIENHLGGQLTIANQNGCTDVTIQIPLVNKVTI